MDIWIPILVFMLIVVILIIMPYFIARIWPNSLLINSILPLCICITYSLFCVMHINRTGSSEQNLVLAVALYFYIYAFIPQAILAGIMTFVINDRIKWHYLGDLLLSIVISGISLWVSMSLSRMFV